MTMDESLTERAQAWKEALEKAMILSTELSNLKTESGLRKLAERVETQFSPQFKAQLLEGDLAIANALREVVEVERSKLPAKPIEGSSARVRTSLYPDKAPKPGKDPSFIGSLAIGQRSVSLRAWIGPNQAFINIEAKIL